MATFAPSQKTPRPMTNKSLWRGDGERQARCCHPSRGHLSSMFDATCPRLVREGKLVASKTRPKRAGEYPPPPKPKSISHRVGVGDLLIRETQIDVIANFTHTVTAIISFAGISN
jgi:hypothetical protein